MNQDDPVEAVTKGLILDRLQNYANGTIGSDPVRAIQMDMESAVQRVSISKQFRSTWLLILIGS